MILKKIFLYKKNFFDIKKNFFDIKKKFSYIKKISLILKKNFFDIKNFSPGSKRYLIAAVQQQSLFTKNC